MFHNIDSSPEPKDSCKSNRKITIHFSTGKCVDLPPPQKKMLMVCLLQVHRICHSMTHDVTEQYLHVNGIPDV